MTKLRWAPARASVVRAACIVSAALVLASCGGAGDWSNADAAAFTAECDSSGDVSDIYENPQAVCGCITEHVAARITAAEYNSAKANVFRDDASTSEFGAKLKQTMSDGFKACDKSVGRRKAIFNTPYQPQ
ncbi:MAG: hypothetical protein WCI34_04245 [Actinomycetes bacterium]